MTDTSKELNKVKDMVEEILKKDVRCRNSDRWLILTMWQKMQHIKVFVPYDKMDELITPESITRVRRKLQAEGKYLPTDESVITNRRQREKDVRRWAKE